MAEAEEKVLFRGLERVAILMMSVGKDTASKVMKNFSPAELQALGSTMSTIADISRSEIARVMDEYIDVVQEQTGIGIRSQEYLRDVLNIALGEDKAESVIDRILLSGSAQGFEALRWMDARSIAEIIRFEHPQIIALVMSFLEGQHAAEVLALLPENIRADIMMRVATLDNIPPAAIRELDKILEQHASSDSNLESGKQLGGVKAAADILNNIGPADEGAIMESLKEIDEDLSDKIADLMFVFDNLIDVDDRAIQSILREISTESLVTALKGASQDLQEKILGNMSSRAAQMLRDDLEAKGPVRLSDVEIAQKEILTEARRLEAEGTIVLGGGGDDFV